MDEAHARRAYDFQQIKRVPLAAILERYNILSELKRVGTSHFGVCPIHKGTNRKQFVCDLNKNLWKCFGDCDRGGSTIELVSAIEGIEIRAAAELIATWFAIGSSSQSAKTHQQRRKPVSGRPSHKVFVVEDPKEGDEDEKGWWTRCGSAWPHKDGKGLNVQLPTGLAVSGRVVLREYTDKDAEEDEKKVQKKRK